MASSGLTRRFFAFVLGSVSTAGGLVPSISIWWSLEAIASPEVAYGQTPPPTLQEARDALLRQEIRVEPPPATPSPTPAATPLPLPPVTTPAAPPSTPPSVTTPSQPNAAQRRAEEDFERYRLGPGDGVFVSVQRFPDLSFQGSIDLEGRLFVPLVGVVQIEGLTLSAARNLIRAELNRYIVEPQVDMVLVAQRPVRVTVLGEVAKPGYYPLGEPQLIEALTSAGGTTELADLRLVRVRRQLADGRTLEQNVDLYTPLLNARQVPPLRLTDGDTVIIPTLTPEAVASYDPTLIARTTLAQPEITIRVLNYAARGNRLQGSEGGLSQVAMPNGSDFVDAITLISPDPDRAELDDVALIRFDPVSGQPIVQELDAKAALLGDISQNPALQNRDVVVIGRNLISRITFALNTVTQPFRDVLGFFLFFDTLDETISNLSGNGDN